MQFIGAPCLMGLKTHNVEVRSGMKILQETRGRLARLLERIVKFFACRIGHDWTCAAAEGVPATKEQIANGVEGFYDYATMYCRRCGHVSEFSKHRSV